MMGEKTKKRIQKMILDILKRENRPLTLTEIRQKIKICQVENLGSIIDQLIENNLIETVIFEEYGKYIPRYKIKEKLKMK